MLQYSPKIVTDSLVMCLDASQNKSYPTTDLPVKGGLVLWLDAADDSTFSYSSGTSVSQWRDKSGNNRHFFQATAGNQPSRSAVVNSRKAIQFTAASSQYLRYNSKIINNTTGGSVFVAWRTAGETNAYSSILDNYHCGNSALNAGFQIERNVTNNQYYWGFNTPGCGNGGFIPATSYSNDTTNCIWITKDSTTITGGLNGTSTTPTSSPSATWIEDDKGWTIGAWGSGTESFGRFFNGINCEVIIFNRGLSPTEVKQVNTYLGQKWGISNTDRSITDLAGNDDNGLFGNGTVANMPLYNYYNKGAFKFFASDKYIKLGISTVVNQFAGDFTVSLWAMATGENSNYGHLIGDYYTASTASLNEWQIMMNNSSAFLNVYRVATAGFASTVINNVSSGFSANTWINVVLSRVGGNITLYANNNIVGTASNSSMFGSTTGSVNIGINGNNSAEPFSGLISNVLIYRKGLSAAEVAQNYEAQKSKFANTIVQQGLVLNLDAGNPYSYAGAGTTWYDVSGNGNNGTFGASTAAPTYNTDAGGNIVFDGSNDYVAVTSAASIKNTSTLSLEGWVFISSAMNYYGGIVGKGTSDTDEEYCLLVHSVNSKVYMDVGSTGGPYTDATFSFSLNTWYHIIGTHERVAGSSAIKIYVNGSLLSSSTVNPTNAVNDNATNVSVGSRYNAGTSVWNGKIATARIYNKTLSATEVLQNYNALKGRFGL